MEKYGLIVLYITITQNQLEYKGLNHLNGQRVSTLLLNAFSIEIYHYFKKMGYFILFVLASQSLLLKMKK